MLVFNESFSAFSYTHFLIKKFLLIYPKERVITRLSPLQHPHLRSCLSDLLYMCLSLCLCESPSLSQGKVAQTACMSACKHISTSLMQLLLDPEVRQISMGALYQIHTDIVECESFARAGPVAGFQGDTLLLAFSDLRQLLDLFTQWDWSTYLADYGKPTCKYLRVNPHTALALLEKMRETSRKNNVFAQFRKTDRDRQKLIDTVIKQLRNLIAQHHT